MHDILVEFLISQLQSLKFKDAELFDDHSLHSTSRRPDIFILSENLFIEVKTFQPTNNDLREKSRLEEELREKKCAKYFRPNFHNRFLDHLENARHKFRQYPDAKTLVIFFDDMGWFHKQEHSILMEGQMTIKLVKDTKGNIVDTIIGFRERPFRSNLNREIGAIGFWMGNGGFNRGFKIFHNLNADAQRRIPPSLFDIENFEQFDTDSIAERSLNLQ